MLTAIWALRSGLALMVLIGETRFGIGQVVHHRRFNYRGLIVKVDSTFQGSGDWYQKMAQSKPSKDQPWYHVLVDQSDRQTYVAERNLLQGTDFDFIQHPALPLFFEAYWDGIYVPRPMTGPDN